MLEPDKCLLCFQWSGHEKLTVSLFRFFLIIFKQLPCGFEECLLLQIIWFILDLFRQNYLSVFLKLYKNAYETQIEFISDLQIKDFLTKSINCCGVGGGLVQNILRFPDDLYNLLARKTAPLRKLAVRCLQLEAGFSAQF